MFGFLPLMNNPVTIDLIFYYKEYQESYHKKWSIFCAFYLASIFSYISSMSIEFLIEALRSFNFFNLTFLTYISCGWIYIHQSFLLNIQDLHK